MFSILLFFFHICYYLPLGQHNSALSRNRYSNISYNSPVKVLPHNRNGGMMGHNSNSGGTEVHSNMSMERFQTKVPGTTPTGKKSSKKVKYDSSPLSTICNFP